MKADRYHQSLRPIMEACGLAKTGWVCIPNPLVGWGTQGVLWKSGVLFRHWGLIFRCWRTSRSRHILVREFSTLPLLLVFPFLWVLRKKIFFLIHHNIQWAMTSRAERFALIWLAFLGAQWGVFETQQFHGLEPFNIPADRNLVLSHPVPCLFSARRKKEKGRPVVGVVGAYRSEKGMDGLLGLLAESFPNYELILGVPNREEVLNVPSSFRVVDTGSDKAYRDVLAECDVVVQNGEKEQYFFRASGPLADAAVCGTAIVVPDFPLIRHQVLSPCSIGEVFQGLEKIPEAIRTALDQCSKRTYNFDRYCEARSVQSLANQLDQFCDGKS